MTREVKPPEYQLGPPGNRLKQLAKRSRVLKSAMTHMQVLQIVDDHQFLWFEATTDEERKSVYRRLRMQLALSISSLIGFEVTVHGAVLMAADPMLGGTILLAGIGLMYIVSLKGG